MPLPQIDELLNLFNSITTVINKSPYSDTVVCQSGKVKYLATGAFIQVENEATRTFPDFAMSTTNWALVNDWIIYYELAVKFSSNSMIIENENTELRIPLLKSIPPQYARTDEIVLKPLLTNKYSLDVSRWHWLSLNNLNKIHRDSKKFAKVTLACDTEGFTASSEYSGVSATVRVPGTSPTPIPVWAASFALSALTLDFVGAEKPLKISFNDNTLTQPSPLLIEHQNGVKVVATQIVG